MAFLTVFTFISAFLLMVSGHSTLNKSHVHDKEYLKDHLESGVDLDNMTDDELKFYYFKAHDVEGNGKLDGCELVQALLHFHAEESDFRGFHASAVTDFELSMLIDPVLKSDDKNMDGFIDYVEFSTGQISKGL